MNIELKLAIHMEPGKPVWAAYEKWAKRLEEVSNGRIKITIINSGFVGIEEWDMLKSGQSDIGRIFTLDMQPFPLHIVPALPFLMPNSTENLSILNRIYDKFLFKEWQEVKVLWLGLMSPYHLHTCKKPVRTLADLHGLRLHGSGFVAELIETWGAVPVVLAEHDGTSRQDLHSIYYEALENGTVDGLVSTFEVTKDFELHEVTRYHTYLNVIRDVNATVMSLKTWTNLPADIQQIFNELNTWAQKEFNTAQEAESGEAESLLKQKGHIMIELSAQEFANWEYVIFYVE